MEPSHHYAADFVTFDEGNNDSVVASTEAVLIRKSNRSNDLLILANQEKGKANE